MGRCETEPVWFTFDEATDVNCERCNNPIVGRKRRFCDVLCRSRKIRQTCACCQKEFESDRIRTGCSQSCSTTLHYKDREKYICQWCEVGFHKTNGSRRSGKFCCRKHAYDKQSFATRIVRQQNRFKRLLSVAIREQAKHEQARRYCKCGELISRKWAKLCDVCADSNRKEANRRARRTAKAKRRARKKAVAYETVRPDEVFTRDAFRCGICGRRCNSNACVPHPHAPTLDHIIPLSKGGEHTMRNVQCACFMCNATKSDKAHGQMRLFG